MAKKKARPRRRVGSRNHDAALHAWATDESEWTARIQAWVEDAHQRLHDLDHKVHIIQPPPPPPPKYP
jgi:hypothetical protein